MNCRYIGASGIFPKLQIPLFLERIRCGFPSPAADFCERVLDLNELCIRRPAATFFIRAHGDSMKNVGIFHNDILVVDRSIEAKHGHIVVAAIFGEFTCKRLELAPSVRLVPENDAYQPIEIPEGAELEIFGVVTNVIHNLLTV